MMKTLNLLVVIFSFNIISLNVSGQFSKSSVWLGGSAFYSANTSESSTGNKLKNQSFLINPAIGKAVKEGTIIGVELSYHHSKEENSFNTQITKSNSYGVGVFGRKYVETVKKIYLFAHAGVSGSISKGKTDNNVTADIEAKGWGANLTLYPGISLALTQKLFLEAAFINLFAINYSDSKSTVLNSTSKNSSFNAGINLNNTGSFGLGIRFILPSGVETKAK